MSIWCWFLSLKRKILGYTNETLFKKLHVHLDWPFSRYQEENLLKVQWRNTSLELLTRLALIASNFGHKGEQVICLVFEARHFIIVSTFLANKANTFLY